MVPKFKRIVVVGLGGVGYWLLLALLRDLKNVPVELIAYDGDTFEGGNGFKRLPKVGDPTLHKANFIKVTAVYVMGDAAPLTYPKYLTPGDINEGGWSTTLVVDCTDMGTEPRTALWDAFKKAGCARMRVSYDGNGAHVVSPGLPIIMGNANEGGYEIVPSLAQSFASAGLGAQAVYHYLFTGKPLEFQVDVPTPEPSDAHAVAQEE